MLFLNSIVYSQEMQKEGEERQEKIKRNRLSAMMGFTFVYSTVPSDSEVLDRGKLIPTIGINYMYRLKPRFSLATLNALELSSYTIVEKDATEVQREFAFITVIAGIYEVLPMWSIAAGAGIEMESHQNFYVLRLGTEYEVPIRNDWDVSFALEYDYKEEYSSVAFLISFGKRFGKAR